MADLYDYTSHAEYMRELEAYEFKEKDKSHLFTDFEDKLSRIYVALVPELQYYPCLSSRPETEYPRYFRWNIEGRFRTLLVSAKDADYTELVGAIYEGLLDKPLKSIWDLTQRERKTLYDIISEQRRYVLR